MDQDGHPPADRSLVVVPRRPGPLLDPPAPTAGRRDELDNLLDDLFGTPTSEGPGLFDVALIAGGAGLTVAAKLAHLPTGLVVFGAAMIGLGLVLPLRDLWRRAVRRRAERRLGATLRQGFPLILGDPATDQLAAAYRRVVELCAVADGLAADVLEAAHLAMVEVADLLQGRSPRGAAEGEYVLTRAHALVDLAGLLARPSAADVDRTKDPETAVRDAAATAIRELEERTGGSSVTRIEALRAVLSRSST